MAKKKPKIWQHSEEELWKLLMDRCQELNRVPSKRSLGKHDLINMDEVMAVLGRRGGWPAIEAELKRRFAKYAATHDAQEEARYERGTAQERLQQEVVQYETEDATKMIDDENLVEAEVSHHETQEQQAKRLGRKPKYDYETVLEALRRECETFGHLPTTVEIMQLHQDKPLNFPSYNTILIRLGPRKTWAQQLEKKA